MLEKFDRPQTDHKEGVIENLTHKIVSNIFWSWDKQQNLKSLEGGNIMHPSEYCAKIFTDWDNIFILIDISDFSLNLYLY